MHRDWDPCLPTIAPCHNRQFINLAQAEGPSAKHAGPPCGGQRTKEPRVFDSCRVHGTFAKPLYHERVYGASSSPGKTASGVDSRGVESATAKRPVDVRLSTLK